MIGRADIEGSKSDVAMNAWPPQASYPCGNFSDTSCLKLLNWITKGSISPAFAVRIRTENQNQASICLFALREVSVLAELALGHLRYLLTDVPPQSNSPPDTVLGGDRDAVCRYWFRYSTEFAYARDPTLANRTTRHIPTQRTLWNQTINIPRSLDSRIVDCPV